MTRTLSVPVLQNPSAPLAGVVLAGWAAATIPAVALVYLAQLILPPEMFDAVGDAVWAEELPLWLNVFGIVVFAPVAETLMMAAGFALMSALKVPRWGQVGVQTLVWGLLHGLVAAAWFIGPTWIFFVFSLVWVGQREASWPRAFWAVTFIHMLNNALGVIDLVRTQVGG